ncbi:MAG: NACHT domain-containing protein [Nostoc sp.]|uniref:NACHT domain-containing protein n=1 Tax=Nostoc sp. TaxID=1180 RepID=UPI002FF441D7
MVKLDPSTINKFVEILRPFVESEKERQSFLIAALGNDAPALQHISWGGSVATFIPHMLSKLADFGGREALCAVLEYAREQMSVHENIQQRIDKLIRQLNLPASTTNDVDGLVQKVRNGLYDRIQNLHGTIQLLDIAHLVEIDRLYVDVNILEEPCSYSRLEIDELLRGREQREDFNRFGLSKVRERVTGLQAVKKYAKLMILGKPGSGKTTFLQHVVIECNQGYLLADRIPILIRLRDFVRQAKRVSNFSFDSHISSYLREVASQQEVTALLSAGKFLLLLDGLDEVPEENSDAVVDEIEFFLDNYDQNNFIITCRVQAQKYRLNRFNYVEVADFNSEQIVKFAHKWFAANSRNGLQEAETKSSKLIELFNLPETQKIKELVVTPILLSLTCRVFDDKGKFYSKQSELYEQGLEILLSKWDDSRRIKRYSVYQNLSIEQKRKLLTYLAVRKFEQEQYMLFEQDEIQSYIAEYLDISLEDSQTLLESIEAQHGLIVERAQRIYSFSHLTFQEYFAAKWFVERSHWKELVSHITDKQWREVFLLSAEMQTKVDSFILLMKQKVDAIVAADEKLQKILAWANQKSTLVDKICKSAAIRAFYLSIEVQNSFDDHLSCLIIPSFNPGISRSLQVDHLLYRCVFHSRSPDFSRPLYTSGSSSSFCMSITCITTTYLDFEMFLGELLKDSLNLQPQLKEALIKLKNKLPNGQERIKYQQFWNEHSKAWIEELIITMNSYCQICQDWQLNNKEKELFKQYYNANNLLVDCLNRVIAMSDDVRQEIEETLFLPIAEIEKRKH